MLGGIVPLVGGFVALVGCLVAFVGGATPFLGQAVALGGEPVAFVGEPLAFVGEALAFVGAPVAFVGFGFTLVGDAVAFVGGLVAFVGESLPLFEVQGSQLDEPAAGLGGETSEIGFESAVPRSLGAFGSGALATAKGLIPFPDSGCAVPGGLSALHARTIAQLLGERARVGGLLAQVVGDSACLGHFEPPGRGSGPIGLLNEEAGRPGSSETARAALSAGFAFIVVSSLFTFVGDPVAFVCDLFAFVCDPVAVVGVAVAFVSEPFLVVGESLAPVGFSLTFVGDPVAFISDAFALVGVAVPLVGVAVPQVSDMVAFVGGTRSFVGLGEAQFLQPVTGIGRDRAKVRHPGALFGGPFAFVVGVQPLLRGLTATLGSFAGVRGEELGSFRRPPAQPRGDRACLSGPLPKSRRDPLRSGCLVRFVPPALVPGRHVFERTRSPGTRRVSNRPPGRGWRPWGSNPEPADLILAPSVGSHRWVFVALTWAFVALPMIVSCRRWVSPGVQRCGLCVVAVSTFGASSALLGVRCRQALGVCAPLVGGIVDGTVPLVSLPLAFGDEVFALLQPAFALVGLALSVLDLALAFGGDLITFVSDPIPPIGVSLALVGDPVSIVSALFTFRHSSVTFVRAESGPLLEESAARVGGQLAEEGCDGSPGDCPHTFSRGELVIVVGLAYFTYPSNVLMSCASALLERKAMQLLGERRLVRRSLAQILGGIQPRVHVGGSPLLTAGLAPSVRPRGSGRRGRAADRLRQLLGPEGSAEVARSGGRGASLVASCRQPCTSNRERLDAINGRDSQRRVFPQVSGLLGIMVGSHWAAWLLYFSAVRHRSAAGDLPPFRSEHIANGVIHALVMLLVGWVLTGVERVCCRHRRRPAPPRGCVRWWEMTDVECSCVSRVTIGREESLSRRLCLLTWEYRLRSPSALVSGSSPWPRGWPSPVRAGGSCLLLVRMALVSGLVAFVGGLVALVSGPVSFLGQVLAFLGQTLTFISDPLTFLGDAFTFVGDAFTFVGIGFALVGIGFALVGIRLAFVGDSFAFLGVEGSQFDKAAVGLCGEMAKLGLEGPVDLGPRALLSRGTVWPERGLTTCPEAGCAVPVGLSALVRRACAQLRGERTFLGGSLAQVLDSSFLGHFGSESVVVGVALLPGLWFALVGGSFALVGSTFAFGGVAVAAVGVTVVFVGHALAVVGDPFALVGFAVALVVDAIPFVGGPFTLVRDVVAVVGLAVALVRDLVAFLGGTHTFGAFDESQVLEPAAGLGRETAKVGRPAPFLGRTFTFVGGACSFVCGAKAPRSGFTSVRREEFASFRRSLAQPRGERACLGGSLPELQSDPLHPRHLARFVLPTVCGGHVTDSTRQRQVALVGVFLRRASRAKESPGPWSGTLASGSGGP